MPEAPSPVALTSQRSSSTTREGSLKRRSHSPCPTTSSALSAGVQSMAMSKCSVSPFRLPSPVSLSVCVRPCHSSNCCIWVMMYTAVMTTSQCSHGNPEATSSPPSPVHLCIAGIGLGATAGVPTGARTACSGSACTKTIWASWTPAAGQNPRWKLKWSLWLLLRVPSGLRALSC